MNHPANLLRHWQRRVADSGRRGLAVLAGAPPWREELLAVLADGVAAPPLRVRPGGRIDAVLGREAGLTVVDSGEGLDVDLLAAAAGTVRAGGLLALAVPPVESWRSADDAVVRRFLAHGHTPTEFGDRFLRRLRCLLDDRPEVLLLTPETPAALPPTAPPAPPTPPPDDPDCRTRDQAAAVAAVERVARGRAHRPLLLSADRGRGKSTALGIAAARLLAQTPGSRILVTAADHGAAARVLEGASLTYCPPDELLRHEHPADLLLVDEAAAIPVPTLLALAERYPRVVFATTVHGYEGTGRGFALRFARTLGERGGEPRTLTLTEPIRWWPDDPLEGFVNGALLLAAEPPEPGAGEPRVVTLDRETLAADETRLRAVFGLLVAAHYRTRPSDLRQLLDAPGIRIAAALDGDGRPVGVAVTVDEGPLPQALHEPVWLGRRRVRGHLLPQSLAVHAGAPDSPSLRFRRIIRIAVTPARRRQGIGRQLAAAASADARHDGVDAIGASFGATSDLLRFWWATGFEPVRLGHRRDRASGTHSAIVLVSLSEESLRLTGYLRAGLERQLRHHLPGAFADLSPTLVANLARRLPVATPDLHDWWETASFAIGQRALRDCAPALAVTAWYVLGERSDRLDDAANYLLIIASLQQYSAPEAAVRLGLPGRRAVVGNLRAAAHALIDVAGPDAVRRFVASRDLDRTRN